MWVYYATKNPNIGEPFFNKIFSDSQKFCSGFLGKPGGFPIENLLTWQQNNNMTYFIEMGYVMRFPHFLMTKIG